MRFDERGMWWEDLPPQRGPSQGRAIRSIAVPRTGWVAPREFPNLSGATFLGLDTETKDPELRERGPGMVRGAGHVVGVSLATDHMAWYFPLRHEYTPEQSFNLDPEKVFAYLRDVLGTSIPKIGANLMYDLEALRAEGVKVNGPLIDVQYAGPLLNENARSYSLDTLAHQYLGTGKDTDLLYRWCADSFGGDADEDQRANIWRAPPSLVGPYAEIDALAPIQIYAKQRKELEAQGLTKLFTMESELIPLLLDMRFRGVRVDVSKAERVLAWLRNEAKKAQDQLGGVDVWSGESLAPAFDKHKIIYPRTEAGNPSFTKDFLEHHPHPFAQGVFRVRMYEKAANPFVENYVLGAQHNGRIHCQFHPLRSDSYGTVSGRFSSSNPNLQNIPSRDPILGPMLRGLFIPEDGCRWRRRDYSQIEYRLLAHDAVGEGAEEIRERYRKDPTTDFHAMTGGMVTHHTGIVLDRKPTKNLNFGLVYGMGKGKTVRSLGVDTDIGIRLYDAYHEALPCVKKTYQSAQRLASRRGYIKTLMQRRRRYDQWETDPDTKVKKRAFTHTALNARLQGGAADIIKRAMVECYRAGIYTVIGAPHLTIHDELDNSDDESPEMRAAYAEEKRIMETCVRLKVPLLVDDSSGAHWGECL